MFCDFFISHLRQASEVKFATNRAVRHVAQVRRLLLREAHRPHLLSGKLRDTFRRERFTSEGRKSPEDRYGGFPIQLLIDNGLGQTMEYRLAKFHSAGPDSFNDGSHDRVRFL